MDRREALKVFAGTPIAAGLEAVPEVQLIERLRVNPGDTIVLTIRGSTFTAAEEVRRIQRSAELAFPGVRVVVLGSGVELKVIEGSG